jgi:hypothetical protein
MTMCSQIDCVYVKKVPSQTDCVHVKKVPSQTDCVYVKKVPSQTDCVYVKKVPSQTDCVYVKKFRKQNNSALSIKIFYQTSLVPETFWLRKITTDPQIIADVNTDCLDDEYTY